MASGIETSALCLCIRPHASVQRFSISFSSRFFHHLDLICVFNHAPTTVKLTFSFDKRRSARMIKKPHCQRPLALCSVPCNNLESCSGPRVTTPRYIGRYLHTFSSMISLHQEKHMGPTVSLQRNGVLLSSSSLV